MNLYVPKDVLDMIDTKRGCLSRQSFILKVVSEQIFTDPNCIGEKDGNKEVQEQTRQE